MLHDSVRALAVSVLVAFVLNATAAIAQPSTGPETAARSGNAVAALAGQKNTTTDDFSPPGMKHIKNGPFLPATTLTEARDVEKYLRIGQRQKERFWKYVNLELVQEKRRQVSVPDFYLDRFEVTNLQFYHYTKSTGAAPPELPKDNPSCWRNGRLPGLTQLYFEDEVRSWPLLMAKLKTAAAAKSKKNPLGRIWTQLAPKLQEQIKKVEPGQEPETDVRIALIEALNQQVKNRDFYNEDFFRGINIRNAGHLVAKGIKNLDESEMRCFNRIYMDYALLGAVRKGQSPETMLYPVTGISYFQAKSCAEWMGKRLPSEMEWEKAARGPSTAQWFPWGNEFGEKQTDYCNWALYWVSPLNKEQKPMGLCPVGSFPKGASAYGLQDLVGNALEITADSWGPHPNAYSAKNYLFSPPPDQNLAVIKGGAYGEQFKENLRIAFRYAMEKSQSSEAVGFRCAKDFRLGETALNRIATDLFQGIWDQRITKLDLENGMECKENTVYDKTHPEHAIITDNKWLGFVNIKDHLFDSVKRLVDSSEKLKHKKKGHIFLGVFHTDLEFTDPPLKPGNYAIIYQKAFKVLAERAMETKKEKEKAAAKASGAKDDKKKKKDARDKKKKDKKKKTDGKKKKADDKKRDGKKKGEAPDAKPEPEPAPVQDKKNDSPDFGVAPAAMVPRILFVAANGKPVAAVENPAIRIVRENDRARLLFYPASEDKPATIMLHLSMLQKYEKMKFMVIDIPLYKKDGAGLEGWMGNNAAAK